MGYDVAMDHIVIISLLSLSGICLYAGIHHLSVALHDRPYNLTHLYFAGICLLTIGFGLSHSHAYLATDISGYVSALRWNIAFIMLDFMIFPWFIASFSGVRFRGWLLLSTLLIGALFLLNLYQPYTIQYDSISSLDTIRLPWGEEITKVTGQNGLFFRIGAALPLANICFALYCIIKSWRRNPSRTTLLMLLAITLFLASAIQGIAVRAGVIDFVHLGPIGLLAMVIVMSIALSQDARHRLLASERRFRSLVEQSPFSIQVLSPSGRTVQVNPAWEKLWGMKAGMLEKYNILEDQQLIDKQVMPQIRMGFAGESVEIPPIVYNPAENAVVSGPVRDRWVRSYVYPIKDHSNKIQDVILMHEDVTERKRVEDAIRLIAAGASSATGEEFFRLLVLNLAKVFNADYAFIGLIDKLDTQRISTLAVCAHGSISENITYALLNTPCANVVGQHTCIYPSDVQRIFPGDHLLVDMHAEGYTGTPLFDTHGKPLGLIVVLDSKPFEHIEQYKEILEIFAARAAAELERNRATDERERLYSQLLQAQKMESLGQLAAGIAHDFNNYLSSIIGYSDLALMSLGPDDPMRKYFTIIIEAGDRAAMVAHQLLAFSRKQVMELLPHDPSKILPGTMKMLRQMLGEDVIISDAFTSKGIIMMDRGQIEQLVVNLAINARDAMPCGGNLTIESADTYLDDNYTNKHVDIVPGDYVVLSVTDTGEGMPASVIDKIFDPFFTTKDIGRGTGLGLAMVHGIVKQHNGHIHVYSEPGKGTAFTLYFPTTTESAGDITRVEHTTLPRGSETILIVDDEPSIRQLVIDTLQPLGYTCYSASCGKDALAIADTSKNGIDLLLTDVIMPGMNGKELSDQFTFRHPEAKTLFMSGYTENAIAHHGILDAGINYITKPVTARNLAIKVYDVLKKH